jgi:hypothetical protein
LMQSASAFVSSAGGLTATSTEVHYCIIMEIN